MGCSRLEGLPGMHSGALGTWVCPLTLLKEPCEGTWDLPPSLSIPVLVPPAPPALLSQDLGTGCWGAGHRDEHPHPFWSLPRPFLDVAEWMPAPHPQPHPIPCHRLSPISQAQQGACCESTLSTLPTTPMP